MIIKNISLEEIQSRIDTLKQNATPAELEFIEILKLNKIDFEFQWPVEAGLSYYIADFYLSKYKTIIELDGYYHFTRDGRSKDKIRDSFLKSKKYKVIHIINSNIYKFNLAEITNCRPANTGNKKKKQDPARTKKKTKIEKQADSIVAGKIKQVTKAEKQAKLLKIYKLQYPYLFK